MSESGAPRKGLPGGRRARWVAGGVAVAVLAAGASIAFDNSSSNAVMKPLPGDKWRDDVLNDLARMSQGTLDYLRVINDWRDNKVKPAEVRRSATQTMDKYLEARDLLARRAPFAAAPRALLDYRDTVQLYLAHARIAKLGSRITDRDLRHQVQLLLARIRYLADRVYDLGNDELKPFTFHTREVEGFAYGRPADVPSFGGGELAPGPPLSHATRRSGPERVYEQVRPEQDWASWAQVVQQAGIPTPAAITAAITDDGVGALDRVAGQLTAASDRIHAAADPRGERELSSRVQLGLLVQAEALRVAQVARLAPGQKAEAEAVAETLALIGNGMWDDRLGPRALGFPLTLLTIRPASAPPPTQES